jgi:hypothetical protein
LTESDTDQVGPADTPVFAVADIGMTLDADGGYWPTAVIDVGPGDEAITDLARVHAVEGVGDIRTEAAALALAPEQVTEEATHLFLLAIMVTYPVSFRRRAEYSAKPPNTATSSSPRRRPTK